MKSTKALCLIALTLTACNATTANDVLGNLGGTLGGSVGSGGSGGVFGGVGLDLGTLMSNNSTSLAALSQTEIAAGLKEALAIGTKNVVGKLGTSGGFNLDPNIHIPLPATLAKVDNALSTIGMNTLTADLENRLNAAAETATPRAKELFISAISQMTIEDAKTILTGPQDSATQFMRKTIGAELATDMSPIVTNALSEAGAIQAYDNTVGRYSQIPFVPQIAGNAKTNLNDYVVNKAMDGIFYYVAQEEAAIRTNPAARTTDLLKKVFTAR